MPSRLSLSEFSLRMIMMMVIIKLNLKMDKGQLVLDWSFKSKHNSKVEVEIYKVKLRTKS